MQSPKLLLPLRKLSGQSIIEYLLIISLVAIILVAVITAYGDALVQLFTSISNAI